MALAVFSIIFFSIIDITAIIFIGFFVLMSAFCDNLQRKCYELNEHFKTEKDKMQLQNELRELVLFHIRVTELSLLSVFFYNNDFF